MKLRKITENPTISDTVLFEIETTDESGTPINPYKVDSVVIYHLQRDFTKGSSNSLVEKVGGEELTVYFSNAEPVKVYGADSLNPAWLSTDTANAYITKADFDDDGNALVGMFHVEWTPELAREGDYYICWKWTPVPAGDTLCNYISFYLYGDTEATTVTPSHITPPTKYEVLLDRYTPDMFRHTLADQDVTPSVLDRFNKAVAKGFTTIEDLANQVHDLIDSNATHESLLPYLANLFRMKLHSNDPTLWRKQIKNAVQTYKKKGTYLGLKEALSHAGITLQKITKMWQVISKTTWQECFKVKDGQTTFQLAKVAKLPINVLNYEVYLRAAGADDYVELTTDYVTFDNSTGKTIMTWVGDELPSNPISLEANDFLRVIYQYGDVTSQSLENFIRDLPLSDQRDEATFDLPPKNWNVRLIEEDDVMFPVVIQNRHPFRSPIVWGKIRTEFPFSENIYNMEEYNGSFRDSIDPCDIDRDFLDPCSDGQSSKYTVDIEIEQLTNDRVREAEEIIKDNVPFHAQLHSINYSGGINEYVVPPVEEIEILVDMLIDEHIMIKQNDFNRLIKNANTHAGEQRRNLLSSGSAVASAINGVGYNEDIVLFSPEVRFDTLAIKPTDNLLEILSGVNAGTYTVSDPGNNVVKIDQGSPGTIAYPPLDTSEFPYRLSNQMYSTSSGSVYQDDLFVFSEEGQDYRSYNIQTVLNNPSAPWNVVIPTGPQAGFYAIYDVLPGNKLVLSGWPTTSNVTGLKYKITTSSLSSVVVDRSLNGAAMVAVTRRGRVEVSIGSDTLPDGWDVRIGDYVRYSGVDYAITGFAASNKMYINGYTSGNAAGVALKIYRRLVQGTGYLDFRGMYLVTATNYESSLNVQDGSNPPAVPVENSSFMNNFLIQIGTDYFQVAGWNGTRIDLIGPKKSWGLGGTSSLSYSIIKYTNTPGPTANGQVFQRLDRRGNEPVNISQETASPMSMGARVAALNAATGTNIIETIGQTETIDFEILWEDGTTTKGEI